MLYNDDKLWCSAKNHKTGFAYDDTREYIGLTDTLVIFDTNPALSLKYLLALLNSSLLTFRYQAIGQTNRKGIGQLPIVLADQKTQQLFTTLVDYILYLKTQPFYYNKDLKYAQDRLVISFFEQIIDGMVYELYLPADLHQGNKYFLECLAKENLPSLNQIKGDKMNRLKTIFERLFDKEHQIRKNIFYLDGLPIIRNIEGKLCELRGLRSKTSRAFTALTNLTYTKRGIIFCDRKKLRVKYQENPKKLQGDDFFEPSEMPKTLTGLLAF